MRKVSIVGAGMTRFGEHWETSFRDLIVEAGVKALTDAQMPGQDVQAIFGGCMASSRFIAQEHIGSLIADQVGLKPIPSTRCEAACASGGVALHSGWLAIASGRYDVVVVGGVEKMTEIGTSRAALALGGAGDQEWELFNGASFPSIYALMACRHMHDYGTTEEQMASCAVKNHANAVNNEYAQYRKKITIEQVMNSGYVASPLKLFDCSPLTDGAAAVVLCASEKARKYSDAPVEIFSTSQASGTLSLASRSSFTSIDATRVAARDAFDHARLTPKDVDVAEVHDCFTIAEIMAIEDLGFFKKGEGGKVSEEGRTALNAEISVNTSGGLKACGHPVGATGVKQAVEITWQLRGEAGKRQVNGAEIGLTHNVGGSGGTAVVNLYKRGD
ncbi:acetyl-CoA acetyltransferase [Candidatus Micrarchaeota archaeon CG10_big_fil_rev_8_21_14_0_10_54_18]|nr:MAG: acetyl-CoA acetyltransferase [Candidatus Micrarchaeota archaeon CG1_02_55_41]PJD01163.1 MAG: acetyl-CoA acetyltransferase [Candidatus Micrarchaeota archaeon CG10_big_fil_rev_8_21_14_0_10_54_18]